MRHFVLVYDQRLGHLVAPIEVFDDSAAGVARRFELERLHRHDNAIEVVLLGAETEDQLRRTHSRYFKTADEIIASLRA